MTHGIGAYILWACLGYALMCAHAASGVVFLRQVDTDYAGNNLLHFPNSNPIACANACVAEVKCVMFELGTAGGINNVCFLKSAVPAVSTPYKGIDAYLPNVSSPSPSPLPRPSLSPPPSVQSGMLKKVNLTLYLVGTLAGKNLTVRNWNNTTTSRGLGRVLVSIDGVKGVPIEAEFIRVVDANPCKVCKPINAHGFFLEYHLAFPTNADAQTAAATLQNGGLKLRQAIDKSPWTLKIDVFVMKTVLIW